MKGNDEITGLFRNRLSGAEMTVRDGFWEELKSDLPGAGVLPSADASAATAFGPVGTGQKRFFLAPRFYRMAAAASVVLMLGAASAAFWYFSPKEEIQEAFTKVATLTPDGNLKGDVVQEKFPSIHEAQPTAQTPGHAHPSPVTPGILPTANGEEEETVSLTVSITISQRVYGNRHPNGGRYGQTASSKKGTTPCAAGEASVSGASHAENGADSGQAFPPTHAENSQPKWAFKAGVGTSLPKGNFGMPFTAGITAEHRLNKHFSLEAGLQYNRLEGTRTIHTLSVPVRLNALLASNSKVDLYATLGGAAEKCVAGAGDNSFGAEPVQLSAVAGLGVRYKLSDRIALFAEPTVSHHFDTDSQTKNVRTERPTNFNLLCGVRMTY